MLLRRWERARQSDGQLVLIVGEPGLGKPRLIDEFQTKLREIPHTWNGVTRNSCRIRHYIQPARSHPLPLPPAGAGEPSTRRGPVLPAACVRGFP
jgi:hypothetical protein